MKLDFVAFKKYYEHQSLVLINFFSCPLLFSFYRCSFDPVNGGEMIQQEYVRFLKNENKPR